MEKDRKINRRGLREGERQTPRRQEETERDRGKLRELELTRPLPKCSHTGLSACGLGPYLSLLPTQIARHT